MDLMSLILSCSFQVFDEELIKGIALAQSDGRAYYVRPYGAPRGRAYRGAAQALGDIEHRVETDRGAYIGLMGIPMEAATKYDMGPKELLDACKNIAVGSDMLTEFKDQCEADGEADRLACVLDRYAVMTEQEPDNFTYTVLYGGLSRPHEHERLSGREVTRGEGVFWESNSIGGQQNSLFFDVDVGTNDPFSAMKTAKDLE